jgi:hypothetical protein
MKYPRKGYGVSKPDTPRYPLLRHGDRATKGIVSECDDSLRTGPMREEAAAIEPR